MQRLIDPAIGARRRIFFVLVDVNIELFAIALVLPIGNFIAQTEEIRIPPKIEVADEHAAKMAEVADAALAKP